MTFPPSFPPPATPLYICLVHLESYCLVCVFVAKQARTSRLDFLPLRKLIKTGDELMEAKGKEGSSKVIYFGLVKGEVASEITEKIWTVKIGLKK